jgi:UTP--glucose-1-phosphate uridylyltransferase
MSRVSRAIVPAAGLGTRFLPVTKAVPKEMLPVLDAPAIHYVVEEAVAAGVEELTIVTSPGKPAIEEYFRHNPDLERRLERLGRPDLARRVRRIGALCDLRFVVQAEPRGLGDAILRAGRGMADKPCAVLLPDVLIDAEPPCLAQLAGAFSGETLLAVHEVDAEDVRRYGVIDPDPAVPGRVAGLVEKPEPRLAPSRLAITGRYILHPDVFAALAETPPGAGGEVQLTDALHRSLGRRPVRWLRIEGVPYDLGQVRGFLQANLAMARRRGVFDADDLRERERGPERGVAAG